MHDGAVPHKINYYTTEREAIIGYFKRKNMSRFVFAVFFLRDIRAPNVLGWVTAGFELYAVFGPLESQVCVVYCVSCIMYLCLSVEINVNVFNTCLVAYVDNRRQRSRPAMSCYVGFNCTNRVSSFSRHQLYEMLTYLFCFVFEEKKTFVEFHAFQYQNSGDDDDDYDDDDDDYDDGGGICCG